MTQRTKKKGTLIWFKDSNLDSAEKDVLQAFFYMGVPLKDYLADTNQGCNIQKAKDFSIIEQPPLCCTGCIASSFLHESSKLTMF